MLTTYIQHTKMINLKNKINETDEKPKLIVPSNSSFTDFTNRILIISKGLDLEWASLWVSVAPAVLAPTVAPKNILDIS